MRRKPTEQPVEASPSPPVVSHGERFSPSAVGVISNYGDQYFQPDLVRRVRRMGVKTVVYSGPLAILDEPMPLWNMIQSGEVQWVYGLAERPKGAPDLRALPAGPSELEVNGILIRHFAPGPEEGERQRLGALQWPPPGQGREGAITRTAEGATQRLIVVGSGLEYERWVANRITGKWELFEQIVPGYTDTPIVRVTLSPDDRHVIVHPTSRGDIFSVIDPEEMRMVLFLL